jgi:general stress protein YciG
MPRKKQLTEEEKMEIFRQIMRKIGKKGGKVKGPSKARDPDKMREAQKKSVEARRRKKQGGD